LTKKFVNQKKNNGERIYYYEYFSEIDKSKKWIKKRFPELLEWFDQERKIQNNIVKQNLIEHRILIAKEAVRKIFELGGKPEFQEVAKEMDINHKSITQCKELKEVIEYEFKKYFL
jgi:hypothetical protein